MFLDSACLTVNAEQIEREATNSNKQQPPAAAAKAGQAGPHTGWACCSERCVHLCMRARQPPPCLRHAFVYRKKAPTARKPAIMEAQEA